MPEFVAVRQVRLPTERLDAGIANPSLDEFDRFASV